MRLLVLCHCGQGGSGILATDLALRLARRGHEVHMLGEQRPFLLQATAPVVFHLARVPGFPALGRAPAEAAWAGRIAELVEALDIDLVHAHYAVPYAILAAQASALLAPCRLPFVVTLHGSDVVEVGSSPELRRTTRWALERADARTAVSRWLVEETGRRFPGLAAPTLIPDFVSPERFHARGRDDGDPRTPTLLHASNFRPVKRVPMLIEAFARIHARMPGARLELLGEGPELGLCLDKAEALGIGSAVRSHGALRDPERLLRRSRLALLASRYESFSLSALEALSCGTPVVAPRVGGLPEVVADGRTGSLVDEVGPDSLARAALRWLEDPRTWALASRHAERDSHRYAAERSVLRYEGLLEEGIRAGTQQDPGRLSDSDGRS